ncbi:MAG TPA: QsdR family transcriptional regulator [Nocardioides sp.]|nr:QsdR family transcriptional regulator [Nocardioides sp.]
MGETPLSKMLAAPEVRPDALTAFRVARRAFLAGRRLEMQELAAELGVSRATVFRWVGGRDALLAEVVWSTAEPTLRRAVAAAGSLTGAARLVEISSEFAAMTIASSAFMGFVQREPERALRLLTTRASTFQTRIVAAYEELVHEEVDAGRLVVPMPVHDLAYLIVRISETFVYADVIAGETPDPERVRQALTALLRA